MHGYSMIYEKAPKITIDTNNKAKYFEIFVTTRPFFRKKYYTLHTEEEKTYTKLTLNLNLIKIITLS